MKITERLETRTTWRLSVANQVYLAEYAREMGLSMNGGLNALIAEHRAFRKVQAAVIEKAARLIVEGKSSKP